MIQSMSYDKLNREYYRKVRQLKEVRELLKALVETCPNTYSGTDVIKQQNKMFKFQNAVNKVEEFLEETKELENE